MAHQSGFTPFPKIARLSRDVIVTEKIDGTNAAIRIVDLNDLEDSYGPPLDPSPVASVGDSLCLWAQSRTRLITPADDNFGFARWVQENAEDLAKLGPGCHFGEWWGRGIQRNYGLAERRFSLFNVTRWGGPDRPACCDVVPTLFSGPFETDSIRGVMFFLAGMGSVASPGFMKPEGVVIFHSASGQLFKKTVEQDEAPKTAVRA